MIERVSCKICILIRNFARLPLPKNFKKKGGVNTSYEVRVNKLLNALLINIFKVMYEYIEKEPY